MNPEATDDQNKRGLRIQNYATNIGLCRKRKSSKQSQSTVIQSLRRYLFLAESDELSESQLLLKRPETENMDRDLSNLDLVSEFEQPFLGEKDLVDTFDARS